MIGSIPNNSEAIDKTIPEKMYEIPGYNLGPFDIHRYYKAKERWDKEISGIVDNRDIDKKLHGVYDKEQQAKILEEALDSDDIDEIKNAITFINVLEKDNASRILKKAIITCKRYFESDDLEKNMFAIDMFRLTIELIKYKKAEINIEEIQTYLLDKALKKGDIDILVKILEIMKKYRPNEEWYQKIFDFLTNIITSDDIQRKEIALSELFPHIPKEYRDKYEATTTSIIKTAVDSGNTEKIKNNHILFNYVKDAEEQTRQINKVLDEGDFESQVIFAKKVKYCSHSDREDIEKKISKIVSDALDSTDVDKIEKSAGLIWYCPELDKRELEKKLYDKINKILDSDSKDKIRIFKTIIHLPRNSLFDGLVEKALDSNDPELKKEAVNFLSLVTMENIDRLIQKCINLNDNELMTKVINKMQHVNEKDRFLLIKKVIQTKNESLIAKLLIIINTIEDDDRRKEIFGEFEKLNLLKYLIDNPLYIKLSDEEKEKFGRKKFTKTGSETALLTGSLLGKLIIRKINLEPFLAWQKAYELYDVWRSEGFDYVPIEPIQSFRLNKKGGVDVFTGVLDINLKSWEKRTDKWKDELKEKSNKIFEILSRLGIVHGHPLDNFVLRFFRDENGDVDFEREPRVYMIDFDRATILKSATQ